MRRMVKENLLKFDGTPLFPERIAYTVPYKLSDAEAQLYKEVTDYVREEFNRAEALENDKRAGTVGFALTILQRRLASSPEAIYQSLRRRRERLEKPAARAGAAPARRPWSPGRRSAGPALDAEDVEDLEEAPDERGRGRRGGDPRSGDRRATIAELKVEIDTLSRLEALAADVRRSGQDTKWRELAQPARRDLHAGGARRPRSPSPRAVRRGRDPASPSRRRVRSSSSSPSIATR